MQMKLLATELLMEIPESMSKWLKRRTLGSNGSAGYQDRCCRLRTLYTVQQ